MVTVIIPAWNEEKTIGNVVKFCLSHALVSEVIVVDDRSDDNTVKEAEAAGAFVVLSERQGKGYSMKEGIAIADNELIVFLDGDIDPYPPETINKLVQPLLNDESDFVKACFSRNAGRITELVAKPLLSILYPQLAAFSQPLSGMIAGRRVFFEKIDFFIDYGVDIGILIDMHYMDVRISEVSIGYIQNKSKPWRALARMSHEVAGAIIHKAFQHGVYKAIPSELEPLPSPEKNLNIHI